MKYLQFIGLASVVFLIHAFNMEDMFQKAVPVKSIEERVDSVMKLLTMEEKIGQMTLFTSDWAVTGPTLREGYRDDIKTGKVGAIFNAHTAAYNRELQRIAVEETRLGIPLLFGYDVIHGYKTIFPVPLGESASWDLEAMEKSARIAAIEATAAGLHWTFAPMVDIARDPRWGRICEGAGEDPYLGARIGEARVKGFQGDDLSKDNTLIACAKHYAAYGAAQAGRDYHSVDISERVLRETYLPPFIAAKKAGVRTFMTSFNELFGVPASGSRFLLTDVLRDEWGFDGFVVTDYTSINEMVDHGIVANEKDAAELSLDAGVDMDMQGATYYNYLLELVREGRISVARVNESVRRILRIKFELGLFDDPYRYSNTEREKARVFAPEHLEAARDISRKSIVLLRNEKNTLPLSKKIRTLAVVGPLAANQKDLIGSWSGAGDYKQSVSLLDGIKANVGTSVKVLHAEGCAITGQDKTGFKNALALAKTAEAIVVAVGESADMSGEAASRSDITLPGVQEELVKALVATGKPVVVVLMNGRPLAIPWIAENAPAILETWFLGTQAGHAIADVLFGDYNPSGKLTVTFPRNAGQIPIFYNAKNTGRPMDPQDKYTSKYLDVSNTPLYPFGFGLSYSKFEYSNLKADRTVFGADSSPLRITCTVRNLGPYDGEEVVQLYVRDRIGSVTRPVRELKGFQKIFLKNGESKTLTFTLTTGDLKLYNRDMIWTAEPGMFDLYVGADSNATLTTAVELR
ncbi:MAG: glycoside hydrolase family 3 C-terminal domain-containing protein [Haliscomenobacter sp.]|nr:glycoside hydrolase family 3 C-terminal domain-containing protein [Haliscomenobacter sp.]MBK7477431.1 glycoside hydrolase family 3 C-terminal domain-containing protein [Haliscomenobacter sp.]MBK8877418.1 glycoside hydrolase family 3 C-terminal domain-containing protein [Haliscomenobacter sp.]